MKAPLIKHTVSEVRGRVALWRGSKAGIGLVPTMGALHDGHLSLVREIRKRTEKVVVSIFVNPAQFAPHEDFDRYPRDLDADVEKLASTDAVDMVFAPSAAEMYPSGFATAVAVGGPSMGLETDFRSHFFGGVATVVSKLLIAVMPDTAIFGEKDYQQLMVIKRMTADLALPIVILGAPIMREPDGLAMSSRNAYLSESERQVAGALNRIMADVAKQVRGGAGIAKAEQAGTAALLSAGFNSVDYVAVRDAESLGTIETLDRPARLLIAAKIGATRLIDNMAV
ncbi:MAG TPA: pantoate--beta-alanine ligase [Rhizomicrobium sp.]|jgi:pantoate--beta-alanine ligase